MASVNLEVIIDGDGHILEDAEGISKFLPSVYQHRAPLSMGNGHLSLFPPLDHLHSGHFVEMRGIVDRGHVGPEEWFDFMEDVGIDETVLYPSTALAYGKIVSRDWAIAVTRAYNDWLYETYVKRSSRFHGMALIPMQEPEAAVEELRRAVEDQGMKGAILPSMGLAHNLGDKEYWPVYQEADRLGCCMAIHGGCHEGLGFDNMNVYAPVHAMGHPIGIMIGLAGMVFNGIFDRYPNMKVAFLEGGVAWFLMALERFESSHDAHNEYQVRNELLGPKRGESVSEYLIKHIKEGRIFIGIEGSEPTLPYAIKTVGNEPFLFSSDYPHEVTNETCKHEIQEILGSEDLSSADKEAIMHRNAQRFYNFKPASS